MSHKKKTKEGIPEVKSFKNEKGEFCVTCPACNTTLKGSQAIFNIHYERMHVVASHSLALKSSLSIHGLLSSQLYYVEELPVKHESDFIFDYPNSASQLYLASLANIGLKLADTIFIEFSMD